MLDLEEQLAAWVDAENDGVEPVTADEVLDRAVAPPRPATGHRDRRWAVAAVVAVAALALVAVGLVALLDDGDDTTIRLQPAPAPTTVPDGWRVVTTPVIGWTFLTPSDWGSNSWESHCDGTNGVIVVNSEIPLTRSDGLDEPDACVTGWEPFARNRPELVALAIVDDAADASRAAPDTEVPLSIDDLPLDGDGRGNEPAVRSIELVVDGDASQHLEVWMGDQASAADREALERMVASVGPPDAQTAAEEAATVPAAGSPRSSTFLTCMVDHGYEPAQELLPRTYTADVARARVSFPGAQADRPTFATDQADCFQRGDDARDRFSEQFSAWPRTTGPSQSPADAARDGVVPAVAALPMEERAVSPTWFDAEEGIWALTVMPTPERSDDSYDCTIGDPDGTWGSDWICSEEYGEVLLVDGHGDIVRAYPMPGAVPSWLYATNEAVYAGRIGDGALPDSTIVRIDRETLEAEVLVFPASEGFVGVAYPGWSLAPEGADIGELVHSEDPDDTLDPERTLVWTWGGLTSIDLPAIEELFA